METKLHKNQRQVQITGIRASKTYDLYKNGEKTGKQTCKVILECVDANLDEFTAMTTTEKITVILDLQKPLEEVNAFASTIKAKMENQPVKIMVLSGVFPVKPFGRYTVDKSGATKKVCNKVTGAETVYDSILLNVPFDQNCNMEHLAYKTREQLLADGQAYELTQQAKEAPVDVNAEPETEQRTF